MLPYNKLLFNKFYHFLSLYVRRKHKPFGETAVSWYKPVKPVPDECNTLSYLHSFCLLFALENAKSYNNSTYSAPACNPSMVYYCNVFHFAFCILWCFVLYYIVLYCIVSYRIVSYRIVSYRIYMI